jgi:putative DNA primase/helicase
MGAFLDRHGDGRFSATNAADCPVRDRAGWWEDGPQRKRYLLTTGGMHEALAGFDFKRALDVLQLAGALPEPGEDGKRARSYRINGRVLRLYPIDPNKLTGGGDGA